MKSRWAARPAYQHAGFTATDDGDGHTNSGVTFSDSELSLLDNVGQRRQAIEIKLAA